jgi:hypothetical protein
MTQQFDPTVKLSVTVTEANFILSALGSLPYNQVNGLITKIKADAEKQLQVYADQPAKVLDDVSPVSVHEADEQIIPAN